MPHISGHKVCSHRTAKTARLDLVMWPHTGENTFASFQGANKLRQDLQRRMPNIISAAQGFWQRARRTDDVLPALLWLRDVHFKNAPGPGYYNMTQHWLSYAFLLAHGSQVSEAKNFLDRRIRMEGLPTSIAASLRTKLREASSRE